MARSRRRRTGRSDKVAGALLFLVGVLLVGALGGAAWWLRKTTVQLDAENCPVAGPYAVHMIMIDRSDPISGQQAQRVRQHIQKIKDGSKFGTRVDIYTFEGDIKSELPPILRVCAPGRPEDANELIENPEFVRRRYDEKFSAVLDSTIESLLSASSRPNSPIVESLRAAAISSFGAQSSKIPLRATLVSDMIQHSPAVSHFRNKPDFSALVSTAVWSTLVANLNGADVEILYLLRLDAKRANVSIQNRGHQLFWEDLIRASGGKLVAFDTL